MSVSRFLLVVTGILAIGLSASAGRASLIACYAFDGDATDSAGGDDNGTVVGAGGFVADATRPGASGGNQAINLNGSTYVNLTSFAQGARGSLYNMAGSTGITVSFWVKGPAQTDARFLSEGGSAYGTSGGPLYTFGSGSSATSKVRSYIRDSSAVELSNKESTRTAFDGTWHQVVYTDSNGTANLYVDGILDGTSFSYTRAGHTVTLDRTAIGAVLRGGATNFLTAQIDDFAIWNEVLGAGQISQLASGVSPLNVAVPEPATLALLGIGTLWLAAGIGRRRGRPVRLALESA